MDPVAVGALGELIATAVATAAGRTWNALRGKPEARAVRDAIDEALVLALGDAARPAIRSADDAWVAEVVGIWKSAFTSEVAAALVVSLSDPSPDAAARFARLARQALEGAKCDLAELGRTFWVEEFLFQLPRRLFNSLTEASLRDEQVRGLVNHLLLQRFDARARGDEPASPGEFRHDLITLLRSLDAWACTERLPEYLPKPTDVTALSRTAWVRRGIRLGSVGDLAASPDEPDTDRLYRLPVERLHDGDPPRPWPEVAAEHQRLVVLADPGLGKSWLIRTETLRLCRGEVVAPPDSSPGGVIIPVPLRCDQLVAAAGQELAEKAATHMVAQWALPERSRAAMTAKVRAGEVVLLLDALDELTPAEKGPFLYMVRTWAHEAGDRARCVITSRIAGYTGSPVPDACEVELQAFTGDDIEGLVAAWDLPRAAASLLLDQVADPAVAAMGRIPLLLVLLCSLAAQLTAGEDMPRTRGQLFDRVLRWFLTRPHRSPDNPTVPPLDHIEIEALMEVLAPLAFTFATQPAGWIDLMPGERLLDAIRDTGRAFAQSGRTAPQVLQELSIDAGVLVLAGNPSAGRSPSYLFFHRAVAEYLVARHLARLPEAHWLAIVERHRWFDPDWAEVIPMLGERLDLAAARTLIEYLLADAADPFYHSLFTAIRVWGARPEADRLLPAGQAEKLAEQLVELIYHDSTRDAVTALLKAIAYLPQTVLTRLLGRLDDPHPYVRRTAVKALAGRDGPGVTEALLGLLADPDSWTRQAAMQALDGREGPGVTEALLGLLANPNPGIRCQAVWALAERDGPGVTEALLDLPADPDWSVRQAAMQALDGRDGPGVTEALLGLLAGPDWSVRQAAVEALAGRDGPGVTEALLGLLADPHEGMRRKAVEALAGRKAPGTIEALLGLLANPDKTVRHTAVEALAGQAAPGVTEALLGLLADPDSRTRLQAVWALAGRHGPGVTEALLGLLADPDPGMRQAVVQALGRREAPGVTEGLLGRLGDQDEAVWRKAVEALAEREAPEATEALLGLLADPDPGMRLEAVWALAGWRHGTPDRPMPQPGAVVMRREAAWALAGREAPGVTEALLDLLADPDKTVRCTAVGALTGLAAPGVTEALLGLLADPDDDVRRTAVQALAGQEAPEATEALLADPDPDVRQAVVQALAGQEAPSVIEGLLGRLGDPHPYVRRSAVEALAGQETPQALLVLARNTPRLSQFDLVLAVEAAERLTIRNYRQMSSSEQMEVRAAMASLTVTALTNDQSWRQTEDEWGGWGFMLPGSSPRRLFTGYSQANRRIRPVGNRTVGDTITDWMAAWRPRRG